MTTGIFHEQNLDKQFERQMGCMAGFLQIFDRHQLLTGKRLYTTKRLPPAAKDVNASPETEKSVGSPAISKELEKPVRSMTSSSPDHNKSQQSTELRSPVPASPSPMEMPPRSPLPLPIFEMNESTRYSWKFSKETPRLSLDSRASFDAAKGSLYPKEIGTKNSGDGTEDNSRRSTSVIARLMGFEPPPSQPIVKQVELRRSASESRVSKEIFQNRLIDDNSNYKIFQQKQQNQMHSVGNHITSNVTRERRVDPMEFSSKNSRNESRRGFKPPQQRKSFFDSADIFPEPTQSVSIFGEIERRLKMRGIDDQSKDLETLKQILEAMQLKGLLHSKKPSSQVRNKNFVYDRNLTFPSDEHSPIVVMKPFNRRVGNDSPPSTVRSRVGLRRNENIPSVTPLRESSIADRSMNSPTRARSLNSPTRSERNVKNSNSSSFVRRNQLSNETQRRAMDSPESRRVSPINSPRITPRRNPADQTVTNRSPRNRKPTDQTYADEKIPTTSFIIEDESSSTISESTVSTPSQTDTERSKTEEYKDGKSLLERCDKLLHSIAEMNATELQPSPVSVLDSSFYKDDSSSPSPVMKRTISFTDECIELEEELGSPVNSSVQFKCDYEIEDYDYIYISEILRASDYLSDEADIFFLLEKKQYVKGKDTSKVSRLQRKLIFDIVTEILERNRQVTPWKAFTTKNPRNAKPSIRKIWSEFRRIRERDTSDDLFGPFGMVHGVLKKDLAGNKTTNGWDEWPAEMSESVLDIERLIFKDLIGESIRDLAEFAGKCNLLAPRRKLVF